GLDLALVSLPAAAVPGAIRALAGRRARVAVVLSSGFGEVDAGARHAGQLARDREGRWPSSRRTQLHGRVLGAGPAQWYLLLGPAPYWRRHRRRVPERRLRRAHHSLSRRTRPGGLALPLHREPGRRRHRRGDRLPRRP